MQNQIEDTFVPKVKEFGIGDRRHVQAQRIWLILTAHVMAERQIQQLIEDGWIQPRKQPRRLSDKLITYGELAERMKMNRKAGLNLGPPLGIVGEYCRLNGLPTLNSIVTLRSRPGEPAGEPGSRLLVRDGKTYQEEQREVMKTDWFAYRVPTTGTFRKVEAHQKQQRRRMLEIELEGRDTA